MNFVVCFFKVKEEVNERAEFLESMAAIGKRKEYHTIIMTEISQVNNILHLIFFMGTSKAWRFV